jgi:hypothetical protein
MAHEPLRVKFANGPSPRKSNLPATNNVPVMTLPPFFPPVGSSASIFSPMAPTTQQQQLPYPVQPMQPMHAGYDAFYAQNRVPPGPSACHPPAMATSHHLAPASHFFGNGPPDGMHPSNFPASRDYSARFEETAEQFGQLRLGACWAVDEKPTLPSLLHDKTYSSISIGGGGGNHGELEANSGSSSSSSSSSMSSNSSGSGTSNGGSRLNGWVSDPHDMPALSQSLLEATNCDLKPSGPPFFVYVRCCVPVFLYRMFCKQT